MKIRRKPLEDQRRDYLVLGTPDQNRAYLAALRIVFGEPGFCLTCGKEDRKGAGDLCEWFCNAHCPACQ